MKNREIGLQGVNLSGLKSFMRIMKLITVLLLVMSFQAFAQQKTVKGTVNDTDGSAMPGVTIAIKGTTTGTITDMDGNYSLSNISADEVLVFSFIGMKTQEITIGNQTVINVTLESDAIGLEDVVVVGYGTQKKGNITGSVSSIKSEELTIAPVSSTSNALTGKMPGVITKQHTGQPGADAAEIRIRGYEGNVLVIVDGIEADFNSIDANQIESISVLKDGSASIYGSRAGNGVILVTTKRGTGGKPKFTVNSSYTSQSITAMPKTPSAGQFAEMERETHLNSGGNPIIAPFSEEAIAKYYAGDDTDYPSTDWYGELVRDRAPQQQHNISVRGGSEKIKYYGFFGYMNQETMWKKNGGDYGRYNLQSNIDAQLLDNLTLTIDLSSTLENKDYPWRPMDPGNIGIWDDFWNTKPIYSTHFPDPTKVPFADGLAHVTSNRELSGYNDTRIHNVRGAMSLKYDFKYIKGLSAKAFFNYNQYYSFNKTYMAQTTFYKYNADLDTYTEAGQWGGVGQIDMSRNEGRVYTTNLSLNYDKTFGSDDQHNISALGLFETVEYFESWLGATRVDMLSDEIDQMSGGATEDMSNFGGEREFGRASYVGRLNYSYKQRYLIETILRADASARWPEGQRWGYFPSVSLGWRLSEENFIKNLDVVDNLKLRASYGQSGDEGVLSNVQFPYLSSYSINPYRSYMFDGEAQVGLYSPRIGNPLLTWLEMNLYNVGVDFALFNRKIYGEGNVFYRERDGLPAKRFSTASKEIGAALPYENINKDNTRGFEFMLGTEGRSGDFAWNVNGNITWSRSKWEVFEQAMSDDADENRLWYNEGKWVDRVTVFVSDGLFTSQEEIDALDFDQDNQGNVTLAPGDIKYVDTNKDGILDWRDQVIKEGLMPHWMYGINMSFNFKGFDFTALFQGAFGYNYNVNLLGTGKVKPQIVYEERWTDGIDNPDLDLHTPENHSADALIPRLGGAATNGFLSDFNFIDAGYIRLKQASLGYSLPKSVLNRIGFDKVRFFVSGTNLLTFSKLTKYDIDPEAPSGTSGKYYPQQRTITLGTTISF